MHRATCGTWSCIVASLVAQKPWNVLCANHVVFVSLLRRTMNYFRRVHFASLFRIFSFNSLIVFVPFFEIIRTTHGLAAQHLLLVGCGYTDFVDRSRATRSFVTKIFFASGATSPPLQEACFSLRPPPIRLPPFTVIIIKTNLSQRFIKTKIISRSVCWNCSDKIFVSHKLQRVAGLVCLFFAVSHVRVANGSPAKHSLRSQRVAAETRASLFSLRQQK